MRLARFIIAYKYAPLKTESGTCLVDFRPPRLILASTVLHCNNYCTNRLFSTSFIKERVPADSPPRKSMEVGSIVIGRLDGENDE